MRTGASWIAALVAIVAATVTVPLMWVAENVADEDGWVEFTAELVEDEQLRDQMIDAIAGAALARITLPAEVAEVVDLAFQRLARTAAQEPGFRAAWRESLRRTHRLVFAEQSTADRLVADIGPLATFVVRDLSAELPVQLPVPTRLVVPIADQPDDELIDSVRASDSRSRLGLAVAGTAIVISMLLAGGTGAALSRLGVALLGVAGVIFAATRVVVPGWLDRAPAPSPLAQQMRKVLVMHASGSLELWAVALAIGGAAVAAVGFAVMGRPISRRS